MNAIIRNPFDAGGYSLAEMTQAINILPNLYTRLARSASSPSKASPSVPSSSSNSTAP